MLMLVKLECWDASSSLTTKRVFDIAFEGHSVIFLRVEIVSLCDYLCHKITHKRNAIHTLILLVPYFGYKRGIKIVQGFFEVFSKTKI